MTKKAEPSSIPQVFTASPPGSGMLCIRRDETPMRDSRDKKTAVRDCQIRPSGTAAYCSKAALLSPYGDRDGYFAAA
ncbi:hypothetical protein [Methylobacter sp. BlB1]|uniref:hypothetical protein n=1 Tax=Methylobacter sp. BlB1 TaxID=2785914 RepID=UPI0018938D54|nr:hypothetical protein [Methylobacter sp. BlB1]MBF6649663.1 hypothetical protein [Methylobacter sp. BlB1]